MGKDKPDLLKRLRRAFSGLSRCPLLNLRDAYRLMDDSVRVPYEGFPIAMLLGAKGKRYTCTRSTHWMRVARAIVRRIF